MPKNTIDNHRRKTEFGTLGLEMERVPQRTPSGDLELLDDEHVRSHVDKTTLNIQGKDGGEALNTLRTVISCVCLAVGFQFTSIASLTHHSQGILRRR